MPATQPAQFGRYRVIAELGRGAMGVVYTAEDSSLGRTVAIKAILLSSDAEERAEYEARFYQEAKAAGGLNHPNIITIHDIGREGDAAYMAMELLEGTDLRQLMQRGALPLPLALDLAAQVAEGLGFAHEHGVVHRDIKPGNVMVVRGQHAKIMDFGIAKLRLSDLKTQTGSVLGTPKYMTPEQVGGVRTDHRSDIFSLGVTIYEMVTGTTPFQANDVGQLMYQISVAVPRPPSSVNPSLPTMIDLILAKALEKAPDARYQSAHDLAADLRACRAELDAGSASLRAESEASAPVDLSLEKTVRLEANAEPGTVQADAVTTQKILQTVTVPVGTMRLSVSRHFDSSEALVRIAALSAAVGADESSITAVPRSPSGTRIAGLNRLREDPFLRNLAIAVLVAILASLGIALTG